MTQSPITIVVALKWVPLNTSVDQLSGTLDHDPRLHGMGPADSTALEWSLRMAEHWGATVVAVSVGPPGADSVLRDARAAGADKACRIDCASSPSSAVVGQAIAASFPAADFFLCGNFSRDGGSGSVPAFLAHAANYAQALGLVGIDVGEPGQLRVQRRLDQGRRELLQLGPGSVLSVEAGVTLRRASLRSLLGARSVEVPTLPLSNPRPSDIPRSATSNHSGPLPPSPAELPLIQTVAYRPRTKVIKPPTGSTMDRLRTLTGANQSTEPAQSIQLGPEDAAELVEEKLHQWGYLDPSA